MLSPKYRYIWLDFETTWLDITKDEPIQLWIVEIDVNGNIIDQYQTLLRPEKELKELKNIVSFITNINIEDLSSAPTPSEIEKEISHFFWDNTVIIWHNIAFDLSFLNRFFPPLKYTFSIDTFQLSQAMVPYAPSHALEILSNYLEEKPLFLKRKSKFWLKFALENEEQENFHDAFFDTKETLVLFCYLIDFLWEVQEKIPVLTQLINKSNAEFLNILPNYNFKESESIWTITIPSLKKISPADTSFTVFPYGIQVSNYENRKRYYVWNLKFKSLLQSLLANKKILLVFSSKPKLDIAKNLLNDMWIKNIWFAREEQTISPKLFQTFLSKSYFSDFEILFIIKYCVHLFYWYWVLDLNSKWDYKVYSFIKDTRDIVKYPLVLTTHQWLYSLLEKNIETYQDFQILFFDTEWRYRNYNQYLSRTCDLYYIQNFLDMLLYKYELLEEKNLINPGSINILQEFDTFFTMFIWILRTETKKLFIIKYCVHLFYWYWVLDLNSKWDYKVYSFIKDTRDIVKYPLVLTTHQWLYSLLEKNIETYQDFQILFFDTEWRYRNYNQYLSRTCDLYYIQNFLDMLLYKYELLEEKNLINSESLNILQDFDTFFTMFIWILRTETKKLFINIQEDEIQINPIVSSIEFYQTKLLLTKLKEFWPRLEAVLQPTDFKTLRSQIEHFFSITETVAKVQRKMYSQSDFYFLYSEDTKFTNRDEFLDIFTNHHTLFLSNYEKTYNKLLPEIVDFKEKRLPHLKAVVDLEDQLSRFISNSDKSFFIISTVKDESREIFEHLQTIPQLSDFELLVENITWGAGKNIYKAKKNPKKIVVWWYNFLMMCYAQKVKFDQLIIWNIKWAQSNLILADMQRYSPE